MSEPMAIEKLAEQHARLQGYLTIARVPFKKKVGHGDFDVIGIKPSAREVLVIECKARGPPDSYPNMDTPANRRNIRKQAAELKENWNRFINGKTNKWKLQKLGRVRLVLDGSFPKESRDEFERELLRIVGCPFEILPIHEMIEQLFLAIKEDKDIRRKRYPDTALEMLRWLIRSVEKEKLSLSRIEEDMQASKG